MNEHNRALSRILTVHLGLVVARERIAHPWKDHVWRPVSVFLDADPHVDWREMRRTEATVVYHAATLPLELHPKETTAYRINLANGEPSVYVVLREDAYSTSPIPITVHLLSASPFEVQAYGENGEETVTRVAMPEALVELIQAYIEEHHVEEVFVKRQRRPHVQEDEHMFGQEPIVELRERQARAARSDGRDG